MLFSTAQTSDPIIFKSCKEIIWNAIEAVGISSIKLIATEDIIS